MIYLARGNGASQAYFLDSPEYVELAGDILTHPEFVGMSRYTTHGYETRLKHLLSVAYYSLKVARLLRADPKTVLRGALLHDFYPYQRFKHEIKFKTQLRQHPQDALRHAEKFFELSLEEKAIISKHMWPFRGFPKAVSREALSVGLGDFFTSAFEGYYHRAWLKSKSRVKKVGQQARKIKKRASQTRRKHRAH
jgi:uncharacterized protein